MTVLRTARRPDLVAWALAGLFAVCAAWFAVSSSVGWTASLSDAHGFRQTQTALTAYYLLKGGPVLRYETPVVGAPWSIPFEFPLFQWLVAKTVSATGLSLPTAGRVVSEAFFVLTLIALASLLGRFAVRPAHRLVLVALVLVSPEYVFWSRTFMIESTALFFSVAYLDLVLRYGETRRPAYAVLGGLAGVLAGLVKGTTFGVFLIMVAIWFAWTLWSARRDPSPSRSLRPMIVPALAFAIVPVLVVAGWTHFADGVKHENVLGLRLSSSILARWNFGTPAMRVDANTWSVLFTRTVPDVAGSLIACALAAVAVLVTRRRRALYLLSLIGFLAGILVFTNLHVVHDYYAYATGIFLVGAVGWGVVAMLEAPARWVRAAGVALCGFVVAGSISHYYARFFPIQAAQRTGMVELGKVVARMTPPDTIVLGFGLDWSSELPFYAERRALIWPWWMDQDTKAPDFQRAIRDIGVERIGSLVLCTFKPDDQVPGRDQPFRPSDDMPRWLAETTDRIGLDPRAAFADRHCAVFVRPGTVIPARVP